MGEINVLRSMKMGCPSCVMLVKVGSFYDAYSKDAYIMSYLLGYKISEKQNIPMCGFPISSISKVELEEIIARIKLLDFFVNISYDKKIINQKKYLKVGERLDDIAKYTTGWLKTTMENNKGK